MPLAAELLLSAGSVCRCDGAPLRRRDGRPVQPLFSRGESDRGPGNPATTIVNPQMMVDVAMILTALIRSARFHRCQSALMSRIGAASTRWPGMMVLSAAGGWAPALTDSRHGLLVASVDVDRGAGAGFKRCGGIR